MNQRVFLILFIFVFLVFTQTAFSRQLKVSGGAAPMENIFKKIKDGFESKTQIKLILNAAGPDIAFKELIEGKTDLASAGLAIYDWQVLMARINVKIPNIRNFKTRVIGRDKIKVIANKGISSVKRLDQSELERIFSGQATNWNEFGGPDQEIKVVYGNKIPGTNKLFDDRFMRDKKWTAKKVIVGDAADVKDLIKNLPGAIGLGPMAAIDDSIHIPETPEIGRPITIIIKGEPTPEINELLNYIANEGQSEIVK